MLVLEASPEETAGGNTRFTAGAIRVAFNGVDDLRRLMPDLTDAECEITDFGTYTEDQFFDDMFRVTFWSNTCQANWFGCSRMTRPYLA